MSATTASSKPTQENGARVIHVVVALCDNKFQGIVPVPARIGTGDDLKDNLYWGADLGVKSYFKRQSDWQLIDDKLKPKQFVLERLVFKKKDKPIYLVADAYQGRQIKAATLDFFRFASGSCFEAIDAGTYLTIGGGASLVAYVGHDGLMNFDLPQHPRAMDKVHRDAVILACKSKKFFAPALKEAGATPFLWTKELMAPEAYVLQAAIDSWINDDKGDKVVERAAKAYDKYQHCGLKGARNTFASGW